MGMFSGLFGGGGSAKRAAAHAAAAAREAGQKIEQRYQDVLPYYTPYVESGKQALGRYEDIAAGLPQYTTDINQYRGALDPIVASITSPDMNAFMQTPGYEFRRAEGMRALENTAAARGGLLSSDAMESAQKFGQDYATAEYDNYLNRLYNQLGAVGTQIQGAQAGQQSAIQNLGAEAPLLGLGYGAADTAARLGMDAAQQNAAYMTGAAQTEAAGMQAKAAQLQAAGDQWLNLGAMAMGMPPVFNSGTTPSVTGTGTQAQQPTQQNYLQQMFQGIGGMLSPQQTAQPWVNPDYISLPQQDTSLPWLAPQQQQQRQLRTQSSYI